MIAMDTRLLSLPGVVPLGCSRFMISISLRALQVASFPCSSLCSFVEFALSQSLMEVVSALRLMVVLSTTFVFAH